MQPLESYDVSADRGYLCRFEADAIDLAGDLAVARDVAMSLPDLLPTGKIRRHVETRLPDIDIAGVLDPLTEPQARIAMVHYAFLVQAYVWGEPEPPAHLPRVLARPIVALADRLGQQPLLPYSGYVLDNWARIDAGKGIDLDNIRMIQHFLGGQDESWFVLIHVAIEAAAGAMLARMPGLIAAAAAQDAQAAQENLEAMAATWDRINAIFDRMPERCDPYIYFRRVRPYIHGWQDNPALPRGLVYQGVARYEGKGQAFRGQTGSQSSIVPAMDAALGVDHADDPMRRFLDQLHHYRPPQHRAFIDDLRAESTLRAFVSAAKSRTLTDAYNANVEGVARFRARHLEYAASYINRQAGTAAGNDTDIGTGGTPFMRYLRKHRDETRAQMLPA